MTITCSECDLPYGVTTDDHIVACPWCGHKTFSPGADDAPVEDGPALDWPARNARAMAWHSAKYGINNPPYEVLP